MGFNEGFRGNPDRRGGQGQGRPGGGRPGPGGPQPAEDVVASVRAAVGQFIDPVDDPRGLKLIENAEKLARHLKMRGMTSSQIRNLFTTVRRINYKDDDGPYEVSMLRAKFAYVAGRYSTVADLQRVADEALTRIDDERKFHRFVDFFEAVVAYHRAFGGRE